MSQERCGRCLGVGTQCRADARPGATCGDCRGTGRVEFDDEGQMVEHGDSRNYRLETSVRFAEFEVAGETVTLPASGLTQSVEERYCATCGEWKTARGVIGALFCLDCKSTWK